MTAETIRQLFGKLGFVPTADQCATHAVVFRQGPTVGYALWYPQMGGYVGKAVALLDTHAGPVLDTTATQGGCVDVLVWHDGEFPFGPDDEAPRLLHHCDPDQFVHFGETLARLQADQPSGATEALPVTAVAPLLHEAQAAAPGGVGALEARAVAAEARVAALHQALAELCALLRGHQGAPATGAAGGRALMAMVWVELRCDVMESPSCPSLWNEGPQDWCLVSRRRRSADTSALLAQAVRAGWRVGARGVACPACRPARGRTTVRA